MSQFWYHEDTAMELARECLRLAGDEGAIACVSAPTLYRALRKLDHNCTCKLELMIERNRKSAFAYTLFLMMVIEENVY